MYTYKFIYRHLSCHTNQGCSQYGDPDEIRLSSGKIDDLAAKAPGGVGVRSAVYLCSWGGDGDGDGDCGRCIDHRSLCAVHRMQQMLTDPDVRYACSVCVSVQSPAKSEGTFRRPGIDRGGMGVYAGIFQGHERLLCGEEKLLS